jgi:hypothetical protein
MRLSRDGRRYVYVAGLGERPAAPMVTVVHEGGEHVTLGPGHDPGWVDTRVAFCPQDDSFVRIGLPTIPAGVAVTNTRTGNSLAAGHGVFATHRVDGGIPRVHVSNGRVLVHASDPALSDDGVWLAYIRPDAPRDRVSQLWVERTDGTGTPRLLYEGAPAKPRMAGTSLACSLGDGRIGVCIDVANPQLVVDHLRTPFRASHAVPVWVPGRGELLVLLNADAGAYGVIMLASWYSLAQGLATGYVIGESTGPGFDHDARPVGSDTVRVQWLDPRGAPDGTTIDLTAPREALRLETPPPPPPPPPDIPWTPAPEARVDLLPFVRAAATAYKDLGNGRGIFWLHKSTERDDWGEWWYHDDRYIGLLEDRSTGTRMVSEVREKVHSHTNTTRNRRSPEDIVALGLGDYTTLPLASYTWEGSSLWMPRIVEGAFRAEQRTTYRWWDLPEFGGVWEVWRDLPLVIRAETGYARFNGREAFVRTAYGKPDGTVEWNYLGPTGWVKFDPRDAKDRPEPQPANALALTEGARYVESRFEPRFPIYTPEEKHPPMDTFTKEHVVNLLTAPLGHTELNGARKRFVQEVLLDRDKLPQGVLAKAADGSDFWPGDVMTGGAATIFDLAMNRAARLALLRGVDMPHAVAEGFHEATRDYDKAVGRGTQPDVPPGAIAGRLRVESGRLRNDAGFFNWQGMSAFTLIGHGMQGRWPEVQRQIDHAAAAGRNLLRVFCMLNPVNGSFGPVTRFTPDMAGWGDDALDVVNMAAAKGLYTQLNIFADCSEQFGALYTSYEDRLRVMRQVALRFKDHPAVIFRLANEPYQNGWSEADDNQLLRLADDLAEILGHRDFLIGDVKDDGSESGSPEYKARVARVAAHCTVLASHPDRAESGGRERPIEHLKSVFEALDDVAPECAIVFDEPRGFAAQRQPGRRDNRPAVAVAEACTAAILGCGYTYHAIVEQDGATPGLSEAAIALEIPTSPDYRYSNAGLGESWVDSFTGYMKVRTCHNTQTAFAIAHGTTGSPSSISPRGGWSSERMLTLDSDGLTTTLWKGVRA